MNYADKAVASSANSLGALPEKKTIRKNHKHNGKKSSDADFKSLQASQAATQQPPPIRLPRLPALA